MQTPDWVEALSDPAAYPFAVQRVERRETHISWLFFAGERVYKAKKPVNFGFVDYSTLARREHFCHEEVRLNRRLAGDTHLGVVAIRRRPDGQIGLDGDGETLDYAVAMRRLPAERMLDALLEAGNLEPAQISALARVLADFHARADAGPEIGRYGAPDAVSAPMLDNFRDLRELPDKPIPAGWLTFLEAHTRRELARLRPLLEQRVKDGRIREGHGDLHAGNICFMDQGIVIYDCVEFSQALRCTDVANDLAFLTMDLDHAGQWALSDRLHSEYAAVSGDDGIAPLLDLYQGYRAMVRAKVSGLRLAEGDTEPELASTRRRAAGYARLAATYALGPVLILTCGLPGTGKSWVARELVQRLGARRLSSDDLRGPGPAGAGFASGRYSDAARGEIYARLAELAAKGLAAGEKIIVDASFAHADWRAPFSRLAADAGVPSLLLELTAPEDAVRRRLDARQRAGQDSSQADYAVYRAAREDFQPPGEWPADQRATLASPVSAETLADTVIDTLIARRAGRKPAA